VNSFRKSRLKGAQLAAALNWSGAVQSYPQGGPECLCADVFERDRDSEHSFRLIIAGR
jgi:hypothetical protein